MKILRELMNAMQSYISYRLAKRKMPKTKEVNYLKDLDHKKMRESIFAKEND